MSIYNKFVTTSVGLAAANHATPTGPYLNITSFRVGDNSDPADISDSGIKGKLLYQGTPLSWSRQGDNSIVIKCEIPDNVGPFLFSEIGIYLQDGTCYARAAFQTPKLKQTTTSQGTPSPFVFNCHLIQAPGIAVFQVTTTSQNQLMELADFGLVTSPDSMPGKPNAVLVTETNLNGDSVLMHRSSSTQWGIENYSFVGTATVLASSGNTLDSSAFSSLTSTGAGTYLIQDLKGNVRSIGAFTNSGAAPGSTRAILTRAVIPPPAVGSAVKLYQTSSLNGVVQLTGEDYNLLVNKFNEVWSNANLSAVTYREARGWGQSAIPNLANSTIPDVTDWTVIFVAIARAAAACGMPIQWDYTGFTSLWSSGLQSRLRVYQEMNNVVVRMRQNPLGFLQTERSRSQEDYIVGPWNYAVYHRVASFDSKAAMFAYFNAGGFIGNTFRFTAVDSLTQNEWKSLVDNIGEIRLYADRTDSSGIINRSTSVPIENLRHDDESGFYGLSNTWKKLWSYSSPTRTYDPLQSHSGLLTVEFYGRLDPVNFQVHVKTILRTDTNLPETSGTNGIFGGTTVLNKASSLSLLNPIVKYPVISLGLETQFPVSGLLPLPLDPGVDPDPDITITSPVPVIDELAGIAAFLVNLSAASTKNVSVDYTTVDGTALAGVKYTAKSGTLTFAPGEVQKSIQVTILNDTVLEGRQDFSVRLSTSINGNIKNNLASVIIADDGSSPIAIPDNDTPYVVSVSDATASEGTFISFDAVLSSGALSSYNVTLSIVAVTATASQLTGTWKSSFDGGSTWIALTGNKIPIPPLTTSFKFGFDLTQDGIPKLDTTFKLYMSTVKNVTPVFGTGTIKYKAIPQVNVVGPQYVDEGIGSQSYNITLNSTTINTVKIDYATVDSTAVSGINYTATSGTLTFNPGDTVKTITVSIINDNILNTYNKFFIQLKNPVNCVLGSNSVFAVSTLDNGSSGIPLPDDDRPIVSSVTTSPVTAEGGYMTFTITLDRSSVVPTTISTQVLDDSATLPTDFVGSLEFSADGGTNWIAFGSDTTHSNDVRNFYLSANKTVALVRIKTKVDSSTEGAETITFGARTGRNATYVQTTGTINANAT